MCVHVCVKNVCLRHFKKHNEEEGVQALILLHQNIVREKTQDTTLKRHQKKKKGNEKERSQVNS
jgi:hypothetical protein